jgi:DNA-binding MarR family transcriptional regulator
LVLSAIDMLSRAEGGPSNRQVARAAGIADQGQTSKLLARLCRQGLIENSPGEVQLRANAWRLTPEGEAVVRSLPVEA